MDMELTEKQKQSVKDWVEAKAGLSEIQKRLSEEFGISMTYMDVRFLVIDLGLNIKEDEVVPETPDADLAGGNDSADTGFAKGDGSDGLPAPGGVSVDVDRIVKPGSVVSGSVVFSDGVTASWHIDQLGRLALSTSKPGYTPSKEDLEAFQNAIKRELEKKGF
jgi:hypothetical protein